MKSKTAAALPYFSIVIATYNRSALLKRALKSLIAQSELDWEAIVVDDGSTDDTSQQMAPFLESENRIKYINKKHSGEASTKNTGISASKGQFITFLDSDDEYHPAHLKLRKEILQENPAVKFLHGGMKIIGNPYVPHRFISGQQIHLNDCVAGGTFFIERNTLIQLNGFNEIPLGTDADLFERAKTENIKMMKIDFPTYIYHHENSDSITNSWNT